MGLSQCLKGFVYEYGVLPVFVALRLVQKEHHLNMKQ
jgi:hypothetical protein